MLLIIASCFFAFDIVVWFLAALYVNRWWWRAVELCLPFPVVDVITWLSLRNRSTLSLRPMSWLWSAFAMAACRCRSTHGGKSALPVCWMIMLFLLSVGKVIIGLEAFLLQHIVTLFTADMSITAAFFVGVAIFWLKRLKPGRRNYYATLIVVDMTITTVMTLPLVCRR